MVKGEPQKIPTKLSGEYKAIDSRYRRDVAMVNARPRLELGALWFLAGVDILLLLVFIGGVIMYIVSGSFSDARLTAGIFANLNSSHAGVTRLAPTGLDIQDVRSVSVVPGKYDVFVPVTNSNDDWYVTFDYAFGYEGGVTETYTGFLNPNEQRLLAAINVSFEQRPGSLRLIMTNQVWHRVDKHIISNTEQFLQSRSNITVDQATYAKDLLVGDELLGHSQVTLTNRTAYAYWSPEFLVKLMRGATVVSLTKVAVPEFGAGETRVLDLRWFGAVPPSGTLSVEPLIPYFDQSVYMNPDDEIGQDVRR
ncbi:MAG: hypothetical protein WAZ14_00190 [Patescibacteria group bacterium]